MIIDCISDLHGYQPHLEGGDLLIVAGDLTARDELEQHFRFEEWLEEQDYPKKIVIAGNHDGFLVNRGPHMFADCEYLIDSGTSWCGLKIWGSPWTPIFCYWHFMKDRGEEMKKMWDMIPDDVDVLITHGPPYGVLDKVNMSSRGDRFKHAGCEELRKQIGERIKPKLHVFGHVHEGYGKEMFNGTIYVNASIMDENYNPVNKPIRVVL